MFSYLHPQRKIFLLICHQSNFCFCLFTIFFIKSIQKFSILKLFLVKRNKIKQNRLVRRHQTILRSSTHKIGTNLENNVPNYSTNPNGQNYNQYHKRERIGVGLFFFFR